MDHETLESFLRDNESQYGFSISVCHTPHYHGSGNFRWRSSEVRPAASLMKLFLLGALAQSLAMREHREDDILLATESVGGSGLIKYMNLPIRFSLGELIYLMVVYSDNTAANLLLSLVTIDQVNIFATASGARATRMTVPMMASSVHQQSGPNMTTADDVALFYRGVASGFANPICSNTSEICRRFLKPTCRSLSDTTSFLLSDLNRRGLRHVIKQDALRLPQYLRASLSASLAKRLTLNTSSRSIVGCKPATGRTVFHDSCLYRTLGGFSPLVVMIESTSADFRQTDTTVYRAARNVCSELGRRLIPS